MEAELRKLMISISPHLVSLTTDVKRAFSLIDQIEQSKHSPLPTNIEKLPKIMMLQKHKVQRASAKVIVPTLLAVNFANVCFFTKESGFPNEAYMSHNFTSIKDG